MNKSTFSFLFVLSVLPKIIKGGISSCTVMRVVYVEAKSDVDLLLSPEALQSVKGLPEKIGLVTTVQHYHKMKELKEQLESIGKKVFIGKGVRARHKAQILGCDVNAASSVMNKVDFFIYIGTGRFHPIAVYLETEKPVYVYNPFTKVFKKLDEQEVKKYQGHIKAGITAFLEAEKIGILMSEKSGQNNLKLALSLKDKLKRKGKEVYILAFDTLDFSQLENFPFIDCFVNTACPRLIDDYSKFPKPVVNASDILNFLF